MDKDAKKEERMPFPGSHLRPYRFPHPAEFSDDFARFTRIRYGEYMAHTDNVVMLYEYPSKEDPSVMKPVAFSTWRLPPPRRPSHGQLVRWGMAKAKDENLDLTLFASPMGERLYSRLGFKDVGKFETQVPGEDESVGQIAMVLASSRISL
ncbi:GNAT family [Cladorrhinum sp. PSN332]|nr:GNAT family [Cladorrhinum sp. PSN332]